MTRASIIYHSSTGNTGFGVEILKKEFDKAGVNTNIKSVKEIKKISNFDELTASDIIGIATPVYGLQPASNITEIIREFPSLPNKVGFVLCTYGMNHANTLPTLADMIQSKGIRVVGFHAMKSEEAWTPIRFPGFIPGKGRPDNFDAKMVRDFAREILAASELTKERPAKLNIQTALPRYPIFDYITQLLTKSIMRRLLGRISVDNRRCIRCGLCASICPTETITLNPYPVFRDNCMACWGCINLCPYDALDSILSRNRVHYKGIREYKKLQIESYLRRTP